jgi:hypothetical protein
VQAPERIDVSTGPLRATVPAGWKQLPVALDVPGLRLSPQTTLAPRGDQADGVVAIGLASRRAHNATLVAPDFAPLPAPETVARNQGGLSALRYANATPNGFGGTVTVYAAPTAEGVATVACVGPVDAECARIAASLHAPGVQAFATGPDPGVAKGVRTAFLRLDRALRSTAASLAQPKTPAGQASAAGTVSAAYRRAARAVAAVVHGPADTASLDMLEGGLRRATAGYADLAAAARRVDRDKFRAAATRARGGEALVKRAGASFRAADYDRWPYRPHAIPRLTPKPAVKPVPGPPSTPTVVPTATPRTPRPPAGSGGSPGSGTAPQRPRPTATVGPKPTAIPIDPTDGG